MTPLEVLVGSLIKMLWVFVPAAVGGIVGYVLVEKRIPEDR